MTRHVLSMLDLTTGDLEEILQRCVEPLSTRALEGQGAALIFEHPSARTRNAAEMAVFQHGGHPVTIRGEEIGLDVRESVEDVARVLASYYGLIGARVARHDTLRRLAAAIDDAGRNVPVLNLLSDHEHPSQALADLLTIKQSLGRLQGVKVAFIGDANNVARSLAIGCALVGARFAIASPVGYEFTAEDLALFSSLGHPIDASHDPAAAAKSADVLYTDVWVSMGEDAQAAHKRAAFAGYTIDDELLAHASRDAIVLHCLPAHRGEEISASVMDGPRARVWLQAENRMHSLRGLIAWVCGGGRL